MTVSIADIGGLRIAPVIILMAWCCTPDSLLEFDFAAVELAAIPYSRTGRILLTELFQYVLISTPLCT